MLCYRKIDQLTGAQASISTAFSPSNTSRKLLSSISARPAVAAVSSVSRVADAEVVATPIIVRCADDRIVLATAQDEGLLCKVRLWLGWGVKKADADARLATHAMLAERGRGMVVSIFELS